MLMDNLFIINIKYMKNRISFLPTEDDLKRIKIIQDKLFLKSKTNAIGYALCIASFYLSKQERDGSIMP